MEENNKKTDFAFGCLINMIILGVIVFFLKLFTSDNLNPSIFGPILFLLVLITETYLLIKFYKVKKYIAIGMVVFIIIPLLVFGSCSVLLISQL